MRRTSLHTKTSKDVVFGVFTGEAQVGYDDYLFLTGTFRRDQASTFGNVSTPIIYPSLSLGWVVTDMLDMESNVLSYLKLRASTASVGSEPSFGSNATYFNQASARSGWISGVGFPFLGQTGFSQSNTLGNPDLRPEYAVTNEVGAEMRFFKDRVYADITLYDQRSEDLIIPVPVAASSGFTSSFINAGSMSNKGVEIAMNADLVNSDDLKINAGMTFTRNRNKVIQLAEGVDVIGLPWGFFGANQRLVAGEAYGTLYGDDWLRDDAGNALVDEYGYPLYSSTEVVVGDPNPDYLMGITPTLNTRISALTCCGTSARVGTFGMVHAVRCTTSVPTTIRRCLRTVLDVGRLSFGMMWSRVTVVCMRLEPRLTVLM